MNFLSFFIFTYIIFGTIYEADMEMNEYINQWSFLTGNQYPTTFEETKCTINDSNMQPKTSDNTTSAGMVEYLNKSEINISMEELISHFLKNDSNKEYDEAGANNGLNSVNNLNNDMELDFVQEVLQINTKESENEQQYYSNNYINNTVRSDKFEQQNVPSIQSVKSTNNYNIGEPSLSNINECDMVIERKRTSPISTVNVQKKKKRSTNPLTQSSDPYKLLSKYPGFASDKTFNEMSNFSLSETKFFNYLYDFRPKSPLDCKIIILESELKRICLYACLNSLYHIQIPGGNLGMLFLNKFDESCIEKNEIDDISNKLVLFIKEKLKIKVFKEKVMNNSSANTILSWITNEIKKEPRCFPYKRVEKSNKAYSDMTHNQLILLVLKKAGEFKNLIEKIPEIKCLIIYILQDTDVKNFTEISYLLFLFTYIEVNMKIDIQEEKNQNLLKDVQIIASNIINIALYKGKPSIFSNEYEQLEILENIAREHGESSSKMLTTYKPYYFLMNYIENTIPDYFVMRNTQKLINDNCLSLYKTINTLECLYEYLLIN